MNDDQYFLANAYLDGELTAEERAIAESDPEVMTEVEELRALQAVLRDVEPASDIAKSAAISAAMREFATVATAATSAPATVPYRPGPSYAKYLAVAAGVLGVGLLGVAVVNLGSGGGDDTAELAEEPAAEEPAARLTEDAESTEADVMVAEDAGDAASSELAAEEPAAEESAEAPADEPVEAPAEEPASEDGSTARPELVPDQILTTPEELGSFGTGLLEQQQAGTLPPTPNHACPIEEVLGRAEYLVDAAVLDVLVAVDEPARLVLAFDDATCELVVGGPLYLP